MKSYVCVKIRVMVFGICILYEFIKFEKQLTYEIY